MSADMNPILRLISADRVQFIAEFLRRETFQ
jgi:hypothetical protein